MCLELRKTKTSSVAHHSNHVSCSDIAHWTWNADSYLRARRCRTPGLQARQPSVRFKWGILPNALNDITHHITSQPDTHHCRWHWLTMNRRYYTSIPQSFDTMEHSSYTYQRSGSVACFSALKVDLGTLRSLVSFCRLIRIRSNIMTCWSKHSSKLLFSENRYMKQRIPREIFKAETRPLRVRKVHVRSDSSTPLRAFLFYWSSWPFEIVIWKSSTWSSVRSEGCQFNMIDRSHFNGGTVAHSVSKKMHVELFYIATIVLLSPSSVIPGSPAWRLFLVFLFDTGQSLNHFKITRPW